MQQLLLIRPLLLSKLEQEEGNDRHGNNSDDDDDDQHRHLDSERNTAQDRPPIHLWNNMCTDVKHHETMQGESSHRHTAARFFGRRLRAPK